MNIFKQKFESLLHRHPWALQLSLAVMIAATAVVSTANIDWAKAFTLPPIIFPDMVISEPAPGNIWHVGLSKEIKVKYLRDVTKSYNVRVVLCQPNPGICLDDEIVDTTNVTIGPATAGTVQTIGTWTKVGYKLDGTIIPGDFSSYEDNTQLSLYLTEVGVTPVVGRHVPSGTFTITNIGGVVSQPTLNTHWRLGEMQTIRWGFLNNVINWGNLSNGRYGTAAVYLRSNRDSQRLLIDVQDIHPEDIGGTAGMSLDYLVGSTNKAGEYLQGGYPASYRYWFEVDVWYDQSGGGNGLNQVTLTGEKFIIDPAGYTISFSSPAQDGSTVWPVDSVQQIQYQLTPKPGITDPFRVENRIGLYLNKFYFGENQPFANIKRDVSIPANFNPETPLTVSWSISKQNLYDQYDLADTDLWISGHIATTFSGENYLSGKFRLSSIVSPNAVMHVSGNTANPQYNPNESADNIAVGETAGTVVWLSDPATGADQVNHGTVTVEYDPAVVSPILNSVDGGGYGGGVTVAVDDTSTPGNLVVKFTVTGPIDPNLVGGFFGLIVINWEAVGVGSTEINLKWTAAGVTGDGTDVFAASNNSNDRLLRVEPKGHTINVASAGQLGMSLEPNPTVTTTPNTNFDVTVWGDAGDIHLGYYKSTLTFDPTYLEVVSIQGSWGRGQSTFDNQLGKITIEDWTEVNGSFTTGHFRMATLHLKTKNLTGTSDITFNNSDAVNNNYVITLDRAHVAADHFTNTTVNIAGGGAHPFTATYYSAPIDITKGGTVTPAAFSTLMTNYGHPTTSTVKFWVGFFNQSGTNLGLGKFGFDPDGYLFVEGSNLPDFSGVIQLNEITHVVFKIEMYSPDVTIAADQPWVESVVLNYSFNTTADMIGFINFDAPFQDGNFAVSKNDPAGITINATLGVNADYVGTIQVAFELINQLTGQVETTISGNMSPPGQTFHFVAGEPKTLPLTLTLIPTDSTADGVYVIHLTGFDVDNSNLTLLPTTGLLTVSGSVSGDQFSVIVTPPDNVAVSGSTDATLYYVTVTPASTFVGTINLTSDVSTVFPTGVTGTFNPAAVNFSSGNSDPVQSVLSINTPSSAQVTSAKDFTVTGTVANSSPAIIQTGTASMSIVDAANTTVLHVTIPLETGTKPSNPNDYAQHIHPNFTLRVYSGTSMVTEKVGFHTDPYNKADVVLTTKLQPGTYQVYARTTRHLWKKATTPSAGLVIAANDADNEYDLGWPTAGLPSSDYSSNNIVDLFDYQYLFPYDQTGADLLADVNNDGRVDFFDFTYMLPKFGLLGDWLPGVPL
jgi:hypothetical protein